jgi:lipoprotein-releasing system ATP-binding protein
VTGARSPVARARCLRTSASAIGSTVAIARALIRQPKLLLCDEPTGNLDRSAAEGVADLLASQHQDGKRMVVVVTHSATLAERFARRYEVNNRTLAPLS